MSKKSKASLLRPRGANSAGSDKNPEDLIVGFIERMGLSAQVEGMPRIAGRMVAWFVLNGGPISLSELAGALNISKASASTNARMLTGLGVLEKTPNSEGRQDYYQQAEDGYSRLLEGYVHRMQERLDMINELRPAIPPDRDDVAARVSQMYSFYEQAIENTVSLIARMRGQDCSKPRPKRRATDPKG